MAVGIALGLLIKNNKSNIYILVGDQECNEGTIWESALLASHHKLRNINLIIDNNHSADRSLAIGDICSKFESFSL